MLHTLKEIKTFKHDKGDIFNSGIWYNEHIKVYGRGVFYDNIYQSGFERVYEFFDERGSIISYNKLPLNVRVHCEALHWNSIITAIPNVWKRSIKLAISELITANLKMIYNKMVLKKLEFSKAHIEFRKI